MKSKYKIKGIYYHGSIFESIVEVECIADAMMLARGLMYTSDIKVVRLIDEQFGTITEYKK